MAVGRGGFEQPPLVPSKTPNSTRVCAKSGALNALNPPQASKDPDLALVFERWPDLPGHIKQAIKTLVETTRK
jgi:hypothetical protein